MKFLYCIVINLLFSYYAIAQTEKAIIKGTVTSNYNEAVQDAFIFLKSSKGHSYMTKTDSVGKYEFKLKVDSHLICVISIGTDKNTRSSPNKSCAFLASRDTGKTEVHANTEYIKDFQLTRIAHCGPPPPVIVFNTNTIISCNDSLCITDSIQYLGFDNTINFLSEILRENPTIIVEFQGHASSIEKNHQNLSLYRAQLIKEILVAKGVNRKRMEVKGWGNSKLLYRTNTIKKAKTKEEKQALHTKNQRVVFRIISWDFKE